ncbi:hypothetical protein D6T64_12545 [Cryobacterium melibiosiphilum]|uniref:Uncharacterized protein n=1 Tax=Cryobacterium melibiosiphilum TaxID=995039 RepID=A0A3A5MGE9_9MICO|nr:hypothetical protein [Cryobacterium melibiosiphilum]RJT87921.1 hypothetical protein D6T64_12545 [Cryobacterium melibiosiphilum]
MTELNTTTQSQIQCDHAPGMPCAVAAPGHAISFLQERVAAATPSQWRDALVEHVTHDGWVALRTLEDDVALWVWHHEDLAEVLSAGDPVAVHGVYHVLARGTGRLNVLVATGHPSID